jgi:hypothetical protein
MCSEDTPHHIFIDVYSECFGNLLSDTAAAKASVALLQFNDRLDEFPRWAFEKKRKHKRRAKPILTWPKQGTRRW